MREAVIGRRERSLRGSPVGNQGHPDTDSVALCDPRTTVRILTLANVCRSLQEKKPGIRPG